MKFYGRSSNLTYNDHNIFHEGYKPSWNLKINNDTSGQQVSAGDAVTIKKGNGINITRDGSNVTVSNTLAAGDGLTLTGTTFKAVAGLGMLVNSSGIHTIFGGNGTENTSARSDHNHNENYDNYGGFNIKVNSDTTGQKISSNGDIVIKGSGATSVSRSGNTITINSTNTVYTHPTTSGNKHIPSGGATNNFLQWASDGTATWSTVDWTEITGKPLQFEPSDHLHNTYLAKTGGTMTGDITFSDNNEGIVWSRNTDGASITFKNDADNDTDSYLHFNARDNGNEYFKFTMTSGSTTTEVASIKADGLRVKGTKVSLEGHTHNYSPVHDHPYDNYGGFFLKTDGESGAGKHITSAETVSFKAGNGINLSRTEGVITISSPSLSASDIGAVTLKGAAVVGNVVAFYDTNGNVKDTGFTIAKSVPSNAVFTDTNTWRDCIDNLTSTNTDKSLSANQGKVLKGLIDGKANSSHGNHWASKPIDGVFKENFRLQTYGSSGSGNYLSVIRNNTANVTDSPQHGSGIAFGYSDTHTYLYTSYASALAYIGGGNAGKLNWVKQISFTDHNHDSSYATKTHNHDTSYLALSGGALTGFLTLHAKPTSALHAATKSYVDEKVGDVLGANDAMVFKGTLGTGGTITALPTSGFQKGWTYRVITAGTYLTHKCEVGDLVIAVGTTNEASSWTVAQSNLDGAVTSSSTKSVNGNLACFDGITGKIIKDSSISYGDLVLTPSTIKANQILKYDGTKWVATSTDSIGLPDATNNKGKYLHLNSSTGATEWSTIPNAKVGILGLIKLAPNYSDYTSTTIPYFTIEDAVMTPKAVKQVVDMAASERRKVITGPYDLNTLKTNGTFITDSDGNTATITNKPTDVTKGFYLESYVIWEETGATPKQRVMQRITTREGVIYTRGYDETDGWLSWRKSYDNGNLGVATTSKEGLMKKEDKAKLDSIGDVKTATKSLTLTTNWQDYGITGTDLETGSYMIQIQPTANAVTSMWSEIHTGMMSWYAGATNSSDGDEIILHAAGHASNGNHIYLRTVRSITENGGKMKLQIAFSKNTTTATNVAIKFRKLI